MHHPAIQSPAEIQSRLQGDHLSSLMKAKGKLQKGQKDNRCPFGCEMRHLDEHGYCRHLIGFTNDGKTYEPMRRVGDRRKVVVALKDDPEGGVDEDGKPLKLPVLEPILPTDILDRITTSSRVYRAVEEERLKMEAKKAAEEKAKRDEQRQRLLEELASDPSFKEQLLEIAMK